MNKEEIPVFRWNTETKEFYVLEHKFDGVNSIEDFINYIHNLDKENKQLKENNMSMQEEMARTWKKLDDLQQIEQEHQKINGELREENKKYKEVINRLKELIIDNIGETTYEYIGSNKIKVLLELRMDNDGVNDLLEILKEVE